MYASSSNICSVTLNQNVHVGCSNLGFFMTSSVFIIVTFIYAMLIEVLSSPFADEKLEFRVAIYIRNSTKHVGPVTTAGTVALFCLQHFMSLYSLFQSFQMVYPG